MPGDRSLKVTPEDDDELERLCEDYGGAPKGWMAAVLLRYGMKYASKAIAELNESGSRKTERRRNRPIPLRTETRNE